MNQLHLGYVPTRLIQRVVETKRTDCFRTFLALKYFKPKLGYFYLNNHIVKEMVTKLNMTERTFRNHLNKLKTYKYITTSGNGKYFVLGYSILSNKEGIEIRGKRVEITWEIISNREKFRAFMIASIVGNMILKFKYDVKREDREKGRLLNSRYLRHSLLMKPVAASYLACVLNISPTKAHTNLTLAVKYGFLSLAKDKKLLQMKPSEAKKLIRLRKNEDPYLFIKDGNTYSVAPNRYDVTLHYKRSRPLSKS